MTESKSRYLCGEGMTADDVWNCTPSDLEECTGCRGTGVCEDVILIGCRRLEVMKVTKGLTMLESMVLQILRALVGGYLHKHPRLMAEIDALQAKIDEIQVILSELPSD